MEHWSKFHAKPTVQKVRNLRFCCMYMTSILPTPQKGIQDDSASAYYYGPLVPQGSIKP